jgi:hypothetical protein
MLAHIDLIFEIHRLEILILLVLVLRKLISK